MFEKGGLLALNIPFYPIPTTCPLTSYYILLFFLPFSFTSSLPQNHTKTKQHPLAMKVPPPLPRPLQTVVEPLEDLGPIISNNNNSNNSIPDSNCSSIRSRWSRFFLRLRR